jgi:hypothetical protein
MTTILSETIELLQSLSDRAAELAAVLQGLGLDTEDMTNLTEVVQRIHGRLAEAEKRLSVAEGLRRTVGRVGIGPTSKSL